jgi:hypothetical protein
MDLHHILHHHPAKRRRLDKVPGSRAKQTEDQTEEPHIQLPQSPFYQASSHPHLTSSATLQDSLTPESCDLPARLYLNTVSSGFEIVSTGSDFNGQSGSQASRFYETHGLLGGDSHETQRTATWYQSRPCSHLSSTYSLSVNVPPPPPASWLHHAVHPQPALKSVPASLQAPLISQQSSEPPSVKTLPPLIPDNDAGIHISDYSASSGLSQLDNDQSEMICFGMVSKFIAAL